jgi:hypothetical protein
MKVKFSGDGRTAVVQGREVLPSLVGIEVPDGEALVEITLEEFAEMIAQWRQHNIAGGIDQAATEAVQRAQTAREWAAKGWTVKP